MDEKPVETGETETRRSFIEKAGKLAVYTPPIVVTLMQPSRQAVAASAGPVLRGNNGPGNGHKPPGLEKRPGPWRGGPPAFRGRSNGKGPRGDR